MPRKSILEIDSPPKTVGYTHGFYVLGKTVFGPEGEDGRKFATSTEAKAECYKLAGGKKRSKKE